MKYHIKLVTLIISIALLLGGCFGADNSQKSAKEQDPFDRPKDQYESVLTYSGDGYDLPGGEENEKIAKEHKDAVVKATKDYLKKEYNIDVEVHNMVGNKDGVTVFFETTGRLHFYSTAIVPIDPENQRILSDNVWTLDGRIENSIRGSLYAYINEDEFKELDKEMESVAKTYDIVGSSLESLQNVGGNGYSTPFYHVTSTKLDLAMKPVYDLYLENPKATKEELAEAYDISEFDPNYTFITIQGFMKKEKAKPDQDAFNKIEKFVKENNNLPKGTYEIFLNDHYVQKSKGTGLKMNSIKYSTPIIKDN
ncbi:DUF1672 family protein [Rossellomorea marisflavi]|uniref:DUF1672 family protein n=1 Tax=Rossellomorea marisflavi TaxID=189381 RepID=UPI00064E2D7C|nr:DUF1672 family protein [Rossellomorea marisflavi]KMK94810.1 hypothetical protein VL03_08360 [Rossellomorea marisflavi]MCM2605795.1 DUF1672 domain-containing protein [Rossellomorea marisflavi]USK93372.1 DUF1672 domain-containing protein [Rossellomorea marisflavi]